MHSSTLRQYADQPCSRQGRQGRQASGLHLYIARRTVPEADLPALKVAIFRIPEILTASHRCTSPRLQFGKLQYGSAQWPKRRPNIKIRLTCLLNVHADIDKFDVAHSCLACTISPGFSHHTDGKQDHIDVATCLIRGVSHCQWARLPRLL